MFSEATSCVTSLPPLTTQQTEPVAMADATLFPESVLVKCCSKCGALKPQSLFGKKTAKCNPCRSRETIEWQRLNKDKYNAKQRRYYAKSPPPVDYAEQWARMSPEAKAKKSARQKITYLKRQYDLTPQEWDRLYEAQGGVCALCRIPGRLGKHGKLHVDHDHVTGRIRGLLCTPCNVSLGILGDLPEKFERVMRFLRGEPIDV